MRRRWASLKRWLKDLPDDLLGSERFGERWVFHIGTRAGLLLELHPLEAVVHVRRRACSSRQQPAPVGPSFYAASRSRRC